MKVPYQTASEAQIREFANAQNIPSDGRTTENTLRKRIEDALGGAPEEIDVSEVANVDPDVSPAVRAFVAAPAPVAPPAQPSAQVERERLDPDLAELYAKVGYRAAKVLISATPAEKDNVFVGVNGKGMLIPRGRKVTIPAEYYLALMDAVQDVFDEVTADALAGVGEERRGLGEPTPSMAYPVQTFEFVRYDAPVAA